MFSATAMGSMMKKYWFRSLKMIGSFESFMCRLMSLGYTVDIFSSAPDFPPPRGLPKQPA